MISYSPQIEYNKSVFVAIGCPDHLRHIINEPWYPKWSSFQELSTVFPDPLGIGSPLSLGLAIFGELVCSMAFIVGFLYRLAMIPMIFTMIVAFFVVHANDVFAVKELAFIYLVVFILMYIAGPGKFSIDHIIGNELSRRKSRAYKN